MSSMNLNTQVTVELTDYGVEILMEFYKRLNKTSGGFVKIPLIEKRETFVLWDLMNVFGPYLYNGNPRVPFVNNEIHFEDK